MTTKPKTKATPAPMTRKDQLRMYKQDQRERDAASGISVIQPRVQPETKEFLERYQAEHRLTSLGAALDKIAAFLSGKNKGRK
jgi:hypothetical protein